MNCIIQKVDYNGKIHISATDLDKCLCNTNKTNPQKLPDYYPIKSIDNICHKCLNRYRKLINFNVLNLTPTIKCACDLKTKENKTEKCNRIVSAYKARELKHPDSQNYRDPVCPKCYKKIKSIPVTEVSSEYSKAKPWLNNNSMRS